MNDFSSPSVRQEADLIIEDRRRHEISIKNTNKLKPMAYGALLDLHLVV